MHTVICHTPGCGNESAAISLDLSLADAVYCGACGEEITDTTPE